MPVAEIAPLDPTTPALPPTLAKALEKVTEISAIPEITTRIMDVVEDPKATARDMHDIVKCDPALAARVLKVVNSAFYGLPSQIANLDRAIIMLGLSAVKNIALAASISRLFTPEPICEQFEARDLWKHSIAVGVCSRLLARKVTREFAEEAFVAGLVHDMGLLIEHQLFGAKLRQVALRCFHQSEDFRAVEREVIGADHEAFGAALAVKWKFPQSLRSAIAHHHEPGQLNPEFRRLPTFIHVADVHCCQLKHGFYLTAAHQSIAPAALQDIGLTPATLEATLVELPARIAETEAVFSDA